MLVPVTSVEDSTIVHARLPHSCTRAPVAPPGSDHRSVGRCDVTIAVESGAIGRGGVTGVTHAPPLHVWPPAHARPHIPQCAALVLVLVSQPLAALPSQLPKPRVQAPTPQVPAAQVGIATFVRLQTVPHPPQFAGSTWVLTSQPSPVLLLQLAKPALQVIPHAPDAQVAAAFVRTGHTLLHAPQCAAVLVVLVSQPSAALLLQLPKPVLQVPTPQVPNAQVCVATLPRAHARPQAPQFATLVCRSTQAIPQRVFGHVDAQAPLTQA
jgi:hypothetical protein